MKRSHMDITHAELQRLVGKDAKLVIEAGANDGEDSIDLCMCYPEATLVCFEPDPRAAREWINLGLGSAKRHLFTIALSDEWGIVPFYQSHGSPYPEEPKHDWNKSSSILRPTEHLKMSPWCTFSSNMKVPAAKLDDILLTYNYMDPIDLLWSDVQGAEMKMLAGAEKALARTKVAKLECHAVPQYEGAPTESEMVAYMAARGMGCAGRWSNDLVFIRGLV